MPPPARILAPLQHLDATSARAAMDAGHLTSSTLVDRCLRRIAERDPLIGAWAHVASDASRARAAALDRQPRVGRLHGIPVGIKDVLDTFDMPTGHGSAMYRGDLPARDAACVDALRAAGAIILGKTTTTEFASPIAVGVRNPHDLARTPGVSSSGSAAAVADGHVPLALGTQTGGSVIRPASYCGIVGYKADIDAFDRSGIRHVRPSLDALGIFARTLDDVALVRGALSHRAGPFETSPTTGAAHPPRLALCRTSEWPHADASTRHAIDAAMLRLREAGATITELDLPPPFDRAQQAFATIVMRETALTMARELADGAPTMNAWLRAVPEKADAIGDADFDEAQRIAAACRARLADAFDTCDALVTPAAAGEAPEGLHGTADPAFTPLWTMMHGPCVSIPVLRGPHGLPVGLQVVGRRHGDEALLHTCAWLVRALGP